MIKNWKIHALAIAAITIVIYLLYATLRPEPVETAASTSGSVNNIQIISASWGLECNRYLESAINRANQQRAKLDPDQQKTFPIPKEMIKNNALPSLKKLCGGREVCSFRADEETVGVTTYKGCGGGLELSYRCFTIDRLHKLAVRNGETVDIDCRPQTP